MRIVKSLENTIGIASVILALSPFTDDFKKLSIIEIGNRKVTIYLLYFSYAIGFGLFVLLQLYYEVFLQRDTNVYTRRKYLRLINFSFYVVLTFIPFFLLNVFAAKLFSSSAIIEESNYTDFTFFILIALCFVFPYSIVYKNNFQKFNEDEDLKDDFRSDLKLCNFLLQEGKLSEVASLQYDLARSYLVYVTQRERNEFLGGSITDCIVYAFNDKKITNNQKKRYERIATTWDLIKVNDRKYPVNYKKQLVLNLWFLEEEIKASI